MTDKSNRTLLTNLFKNCLDILRDNESLVGDKALRTFGYLLILRTLENKKLDTVKINFNNRVYPNLDKLTREKVLLFTKFSNLAQSKDDNLPKIMDIIWKCVLCEHPQTKDIFNANDSFGIKNTYTYVKLVKKLNEFDFESIDHDIQGEAYEDMAQDILIGKVLGQFFTPPMVKKFIINKLIKPRIKKNGQFETIYDPAMGTGGFLITALRYLQKTAKVNNVNIDWNFATKQDGIGGREVEKDTYKLAKANLLISTGHIFNNIDCDNSIRNPIIKKYDIIVTNPPYGIGGFNYSEINHKLRNEYLPIRTNNAVSLFIQSVIYILKENGRCAIVVPNGQDLFSTNKTYVAIRQLLLKSCDLQAVYYFPPNVFTNTSIKTCVLYFIKKKLMKDVLKITPSYSKTTQKEIKRGYKFCEYHSTNNIKFYDCDIINSKVKLLVTVPIKDISNNNYSLNYSEYIKEEVKIFNKNIIVKKLGDICELKNGQNITKKEFIDGPYPVIGGGQKPLGFHNKYNVLQNTIIISKYGTYAGYVSKYNQKNFVSNNGIYVKEVNKLVNKYYLYYYLKYIQNNLYKLRTGTAQPMIKIQYLTNVNIPIPSMEVQDVIVKQLDIIYNKCIHASQVKIKQLESLNKLCIRNQIEFGKNQVKKLGDICKVKQGKYLTKTYKIEGIYPVFGGGNISFYINQYNRENDIIISKDGVSENCVRYYNDKFFLNHHGWTIDIIYKHIIKKYLYYHLLVNQSQLYNIAKGTAQKGINQINFYSINIPIPSIEKQKYIVNYCEKNDQLINELKEEIERNKELANNIIKTIIE